MSFALDKSFAFPHPTSLPLALISVQSHSRLLSTHPPIMSLAKLSTELDNSILRLCDYDALRALCATSKYYRNLAEPYLYEKIDFTVDDAEGMRLLVLTLLKRPDLGKHIKSVVVCPLPNPGRAIPWNDVPADIKDENGENGSSEAVRDFLSLQDLENQKKEEEWRNREFQAVVPLLTKYVQSAWPNLRKVWKDCWAKVIFANTNPNVEACVAFVWTVAVNVKPVYFQLNMGYESWLDWILLDHDDHIDPKNGARPLQKLERVVLRGLKSDGHMVHWVPLPANITSLSLSRYYIDHFEYPGPYPEDFEGVRYRLNDGAPQLRKVMMPLSDLNAHLRV